MRSANEEKWENVNQSSYHGAELSYLFNFALIAALSLRVLVSRNIYVIGNTRTGLHRNLERYDRFTRVSRFSQSSHSWTRRNLGDSDRSVLNFATPDTESYSFSPIPPRCGTVPSFPRTSPLSLCLLFPLIIIVALSFLSYRLLSSAATV